MKEFGLLVVDKPIGPTSHRVVSVVRQGTGVRKVGHAGTLDPRASGVLVLCLGAATRLSEFLSTSTKGYAAVVRFGTATRTYDGDGEVVRHTGAAPDRAEVEAVLPQFTGTLEQVPPPFSAIKISGRKAYELARRGEEVELGPRRVTIDRLEVVSYEPPDLTMQIECSAGTYIRSLAHDLGERLSCGAHLWALRRTRAGPFTLDQAVSLARLEAGFGDGSWETHLRPATDALRGMPKIPIGLEALERVRNGHSFAASGGAAGLAAGIGPDGELAAILEGSSDGQLWHPRKVFLS